MPYAQDVAAVVGADGHRLRLDIALMWLGAADFTIGTPATGLGSPAISAADFTSSVQTTIDTVLAAISDVTRTDGVRVVDTIFFAPEVLIPGPGETDGNPNEGWFLTTNYPYLFRSFPRKVSGQVFTSGLMGIRPMWTTALTSTRFTPFSTAAAPCFGSTAA